MLDDTSLRQDLPALGQEQQLCLYKSMADNTSNPVSIKDLDGRYLYVNPVFTQLFNKTAPAFVGLTDFDLFPRDLAALYRKSDLEAQGSLQAIHQEEIIWVNGEERHYHSVKFGIRDQNDHLFATGQIANDMTTSKQTARQLWVSEERFRQAFEHAMVGMCLADTQGVLLRANPQFCRILGYSQQELEGMNVRDITHPDSKDITPTFIRQALAGEVSSAEYVKYYIHKQGHKVCCRIASSLVRDRNNQPAYFIAHASDITDSLRVEAELKRLANTDPLTGVANRRPFLEQMATELARVRRFGTPASCLMLDFDHFKSINDQWGHSSGDAVLQHFTQLCQQRLRVTDLLGRLGGEEFAILMPGTALDGALELAEQLRLWVADHPLDQGDQHIEFHISLGVTELSAHDHSADEVLARVDAALYRAKDLGRNRVEAAR